MKLYSGEYYTLKRNSYYSSLISKECGARGNDIHFVPSAYFVFGNKNKALRRFSYILKKGVLTYCTK